MMKLKKTIAYLGVFIVMCASADELKINSYGKYFSGEGIEVNMAFLKDKNESGLHDALIQITGAAASDAQIDGKVILHKAIPAGTGVDFKTPEGKNRMGTRKAWGAWDFFEVYLAGKSYKVYFDEKKSKDIKVDLMLKSYKK